MQLLDAMGNIYDFNICRIVYAKKYELKYRIAQQRTYNYLNMNKTKTFHFNFTIHINLNTE